MKEQFPNIIHLMEIAWVLPVSSVECERGFSRQNLIKTKLWCRLSIDTLDDLMSIDLVGVSVEDFDTKPALRNWQKFEKLPSVLADKVNAFSKLMNIRWNLNLNINSYLYSMCWISSIDNDKICRKNVLPMNKYI